MGLLKYRRSRQRRDTGRAHKKLTAPKFVVCSKCGELKLPHRVCKHCGHYKDNPIISKH